MEIEIVKEVVEQTAGIGDIVAFDGYTWIVMKINDKFQMRGFDGNNSWYDSYGSLKELNEEIKHYDGIIYKKDKYTLQLVPVK